MATGRRQYTEDEKAQTLAFLAANGGCVGATAKQMGFPETTVRRWAGGGGVNAAVGEKALEYKRDLAAAMDEKIWLMLDGLSEKKIADTAVNVLVAGIGALVDKARLLREQPGASEAQAAAVATAMATATTVVRIEYVGGTSPSSPLSEAERGCL